MDFKTILALFLQALGAYLNSKQTTPGAAQTVTTTGGAITDYESAMALQSFIKAIQAQSGKP